MRHLRTRTSTQRGSALWSVALGVGLVVVAPASLARAQDDDREVKSFSLPETASAKQLFDRAREHADAGRFGDAISGFQELVEQHRGAVLGAERRDPRGRASQQDFHTGVVARVTELLIGLPEDARRIYRERFGTLAAGEFGRACRAGDARALAELARRWPITVAAEQAWVALGDLEFERGNVDAALLAWRRADELARALGDTLELGATRAALFDAASDAARSLARPSAGALVLDDGERAHDGLPELGPLPGEECHVWRRKLLEDDPSVAVSLRYTQSAPVMTPVLVGDRVLVSTPLRLIAYNAYSGHREWRSEEHPGWKEVDAGRVRPDDADRALQRSDFFQGINADALMLAPTAWGNVAVAALQIPYTTLRNDKYQNIQITTITPERRLFGFDLATGDLLWSHLPPPLWDGESGSFSERMRVAGPPVAWQGRVFAPFYRMQGRVEFHVGCFDLYTGALYWSTQLISGQVELNMFGRQSHELATPPLLIHDGRVIAQTQLGALAAIDAFSGDIVWESLYEQIPLPQAQGYQSGQRDEVWLASPAVVADGVVVAAPLDCDDLIGVDAEHGTLLWSKPHSRLASRITSRLALLGADERSVVLGSAAQVLQLASRAGLSASQGPTDLTWSERALGDGFLGPENQPRPLLVGERVVVPSSSKRWVLPRANLRTPDTKLTAAWPSDAAPGNLAAGAGVLYSLSSNTSGATLVGMCDWTSLEERLQRDFERAPENVDMACAWADFLESRANLELREGRTAKALGYFARLSAALEPLVDVEAPAHRPDVARRLHSGLLGEARALADLADVRGATERLERSRALALDARAQRDSLYELALLARGRDGTRYRSLLVELDDSSAALELPSIGADTGAADRVEPVGLWVQRELAALGHAEGAVGPELEALHTLLERYGDVPLAHSAEAASNTPTREAADRYGAQSVSARIRELIGRNPPPEYAAYEARATELLDAGIAAHDLRLLMRIRVLFPHSQAAGRAIEAALSVARDEQRLDLYAEELGNSLGDSWSFARANATELARLADFAHLACKVGERGLGTALYARLATIAPDLRVAPPPPLVGTELAASDVARTLLGEARPSAATEASFDDTIRPRGARSAGAWDLLGYLPLAPDAPADAPRHLVASTRGWLDVWRAGAPPERIFRHRLGDGEDPEVRPNRVVLGPDRIVIGLPDEVVAIDVTEPARAWGANVIGESVETLDGADGVIVAAFVERGRDVTLRAYSEELGAELWERNVGADVSLPPVIGDGRLVLLPRGRGVRSAQIFDLFTGQRSAKFELDADGWEQDGRAAWIERGKVILPAFRRNARSAPEMLRAFDLESGAKAWSVPVESGRELESVLRSEGRAYLVLAGEANAGRVQLGGFLELDAALGALRPLQNAKLAAGDVLIGVPRLAVVELDTPFVFVRGEAPGVRETLLRAIHLPYGERWSTRLSVPVDALYNGSMPRPVVSQSTVAVVYGEYTRNLDGERDRRTSLALFDRASGQRRDLRTLERGLGSSDMISMLGLGSALFVASGGGMDVFSK